MLSVEYVNSTYLILGSKMLLMPPSLTLIFKHRLERVCGDVLFTFLAWTHCVAKPNMMSPTRFTSAKSKVSTFQAMCYHISIIFATIQVYWYCSRQCLGYTKRPAHFCDQSIFCEVVDHTSKQIMLDLDIFNFNWGKMKNMLDFSMPKTMPNWSPLLPFVWLKLMCLLRTGNLPNFCHKVGLNFPSFLHLTKLQTSSCM